MASYALLVIDVQVHFEKAVRPILTELNLTIESCRDSSIPVIYTQHGHVDPSTDGASLGRKWGIENLIIYGSDEWQLTPELKIRDTDELINEKRTYDAFHGTRLEGILRGLGVDTVIIAGVLTELCCETTARSAFVKGFDILFLNDGTGSFDSTHHANTLEAIKFGFGKVLSCEELRKIIAKK